MTPPLPPHADDEVGPDLCEVCELELARYTMTSTAPATDDERSNGPDRSERIKRMCTECAWESFEAGTHEAL